jgi:hypothetical protein
MSTQNGLVNGSNMCYRNSIIQCLIALPAIKIHISTVSEELDDEFIRVLRIVIGLFKHQQNAVDIEKNDFFSEIPSSTLRINSKYEQNDAMDYFCYAIPKSKCISDMFTIDMFQVDVYGTQIGPHKTTREITSTQHLPILANNHVTAQDLFRQRVSMLEDKTQQTTYTFPINNSLLLCLHIDNPEKNMRITEKIIVEHVRRPGNELLHGVVQYDLYAAIFRNNAASDSGGHFVACTFTDERWMCHVSSHALHFPCAMKLCTLIGANLF